jgi:hypothetical protein
LLLLLLLLIGGAALTLPAKSPINQKSRAETALPVPHSEPAMRTCCCAPSETKQESVQKSPIDPVFAEFQEWAEKAAAEKLDKAEIARGLELARTRRTAMSRLIQSDPKRALEETLPFALRSAMPNEVSGQLEERVDTVGSYMVAIADGFDMRSNVSREVQANGKTYHASVYGKRIKQSSLLNVPLHGVALDNEMALSESPIRVLDPGELPDPKKPILNPDGTCPIMSNVVSRSVTIDAGDTTVYVCCAICTAALEKQLANQGGSGGVAGAPVAGSAWTTGPKTVLFIRVDTTDKLGDTITQAAAQTLVGTTTSNFYQDCSYNQTSMTCTATATTLHLPNTSAYYANNFAAILSDAVAAANAAGYNDSAYDLDVVGTPALGNGYAGQAYVGAKGAVFYDSYTLYTSGHELGHNYGVWHANYWSTTDGTTIGTGSNAEYGDTWSIMSTSFGTPACHFDTQMKSSFGWLTASQVTNVTSSGTYQIYAFDSTSANPLPATDVAALSIPKVGDVNGRVYWLQFRQQFTSDKWRMNGAELLWAPWGSSNGGTQLLDTTPNSANGKNDAPIVIGRTFADTSSGVYITPVSKGGTTPESLNVVVNIGSFPGNLPPTVSVTPSATSVAINTAVNFTATASDPNGDTLAYYWDFGDGTFGIPLNSTTASHSWTAAGQYLVRCIVSDMKGGESQASVVITVGAPTTFIISGTVADTGGTGIEGVLVYTSTTKSTYTNSDGTYNLVGLAAGSYTVTAAKQGFTMTPAFTNPVVVGPNATGINFTASIPTFTISGNVSSGGTNVSGVIVSDGTRSTTTNTSGNYTLSGVPDGSYTLTATLSGYTFIPSGWSNPVSVQDANITAENFVTPVYSISGSVTGPTSAVTITDGVRTTTSVKQGNKWSYTLSNVPQGTWNIRASLAGWVLTPSLSNPLTVNGNISNENFSGVAGTVFTVSGNITSGGSPLTGAVVSDGTRSSTSDSLGNYCIINVPNGTYTLTPSGTGYSFSPTTLAAAVSGANLTGKNFTANSTTGPTISTTSPLAAGDVNASYTKTFAASGGSTPYTWSVTAGSPPAGLTLASATGILSGTPTTAGTSTFTITVTDSASRTNSKSFSLTINADPTITTASLPAGDVGTAYSQTVAASGGSGNGYTYSLASGTLPTGLSLSSAGVISGTPTTATGSPFSFTVQVTDSVGGTGSKAFSVTINPALAISTSSPMPVGDVGIAYSQTFAATGGTGSLTWSVSAGSLPAGLTLSSAGALTGTPTAAGTSNFTIKVTDAAGAAPTKAFALTINAAPSITTASLPGGDLTVAYSQTLAASGGTTPYTWSITVGTLPAGLSLTASTGAITGTPTAAGSSTFTVKVADNLGASATKSLTIVISALPSISTSSPLAAGSVGAAYSQTLAGSGGTTPYSWSVTSGTLPAGLTLSSAGVLSGTPTTSGTSNFTVTLTDAAGGTASKAFALTINPGVTITTASPLPGGDVGTAYSQTFAASGGTTPYTWTISFGTAPAGLTLSSAGVLSGTPTTAGSSTFTVKVTDNVGATSTKSFTLVIATAPSITTASLPAGDVSVAYSQTLAESGGTSPFTWSLSSGTLPTGLTISAAGVISGTPSAAGTFSFTVKVADSATGSATKSLSIVINALPSITTSSPLPAGSMGAAYSQTFAGSGGTTPYTWAVASGTLPAGLTLSSAGVLSGTPTGSGTSNFTVTLTDAVGGTASTAFALTINPGVLITTASPLPGGDVGATYSQTFAASGGTTPYTWTISSGTAPAGLTLSSAGVLSGTPTTAGSSTFTVKVTDNVGATSTKSFTLVIAAAPSITTASLPAGDVSVAYSQTLAESGGTSPFTWSLSSGSLPTGLTISAAGVISGTPSATGTFSFTVKVTDAATASATKSLSIQINAQPTISTSSPLPAGDVGTAYSKTFAASGGTGAYTWSVISGTLPTGLTLSTAGVLSGTPTAVGNPFSFTVQVADTLGGKGSTAFTVVINPAPSITTTSLASGVAGSAYSQSVAGSGGTTPYTWSISVGSLPPGLTIGSSSGAITGTPSAAGTYNFTVKLTDSVGAAATKALSIVITGPLNVNTSSLANGDVGVAYSATLVAGGGTPPYTWSITTGSLPTGVSLNASTGALTGTPSAAGTFSFTVKVTDSVSATATQALSITINPAPTITTASPLPNGSVGGAYSQSFAISGGTPSFTWSVSSGTLPAGLALSSGGALTGTPTTAGTSSFTIKAADSVGGSATQAYTLTITPPSVLTTITVAPGSVTLGPAGTQQFSATAYDQNNSAMVPQPSFTWSVNGGGTVSSSGLFTAGSGAGTFTITATSGTVSGSIGVTVDLPPTIVSPPSFNPTTVVTNVPVNFSASGSDPAGGSVNYNWNFGDGGSGTGSNVTYTFTTAGSFTVTFTMTNSIGGTTTTTLTINVLDGSAVGGGGSTGQTIPMTVTKMQGVAKFTSGGHDSCTIAGVLPNLPKLFDPTGQTLVLNIDGASVSFTLDSKGRGKTGNGSIALKLKPSKRNPVTKKLEFQGGNVTFAAKIMNGTWATVWGLDPKAALSNVSMSIPATIVLSGNTYVVTVTTTYSDKPGVGGKFKK